MFSYYWLTMIHWIIRALNVKHKIIIGLDYRFFQGSMYMYNYYYYNYLYFVLLVWVWFINGLQPSAEMSDTNSTSNAQTIITKLATEIL